MGQIGGVTGRAVVPNAGAHCHQVVDMELTLAGEAASPIVASRPGTAESNLPPAASISIMTVPVATEAAMSWSQLAMIAGCAPFLRPEWIFPYRPTFRPRASLE